MSLTSRLSAAAAALFRRPQVDQDMDEELRAHIADRAADLERSGLAPAEARRRARLEFGGYQKFKEQSREVAGIHVFENMRQDIRFGLRMLGNSPGFTLVAVLTLALGIGANTAVFSIVNSVLIRPLPLKDSGRIISISTSTPMFPLFNLGSSWLSFQQIRSQVPSLEQVVVFSSADRTLTNSGAPAQLLTASISENFFEYLGGNVQAGRLLNSQDQNPGHSLVAILSDSLWRSQFGADPSVLGRTITLDSKPYSIVGVAARDFCFPEKTQVWLPVAPTPEIQQQATFFMYQILGKLRSGRKLAQADAELATISVPLAKDHPELSAGIKFKTIPLLESRVQNSRTAYLMLLGASSLVLLIACANLASLLLARGSARQREMAMRAALGASRGRLMRQCLVESLLIALGGAALGAFLASAGVDLFRTIAPAETPRLAEIRVDATLLLWSLVAALVSGILFGLAPARRAAAADPSDSLKESSGSGQGSARTVRQMRLGNLLVVVEVALAFVLLIGSALMTRTVYNLLHQNPGFRTERLLTFDIPRPQLFNEDKAVAERENARLRQMLERVRGIPGVEAAAATDHELLGGTSMMHSRLEVEGVPDSEVQKRRASERYISAGYFSMLGVPLLRGREFTEHDDRNRPKAAVVNEAMARAYWGTLDALGKRISIERDEKSKEAIWTEVVGVVADIRDTRINNEATPQYYLSLLSTGSSSASILVRTLADPDVLATAITKEIWQQFPDQPVTHIETMTHTIVQSVGDQRLRSVLLTVFAGIGFALALIGAYGVVSYSVSRRIPEIGIRMALGATPHGVLRMILRQGILLVALGVAIGAAAAAALTRVIASQLYGVKPADPFTFITSTVVVLAVACLACWIPARRAMHVDPIVALRYE